MVGQFKTRLAGVKVSASEVGHEVNQTLCLQAGAGFADRFTGSVNCEFGALAAGAFNGVCSPGQQIGHKGPVFELLDISDGRCEGHYFKLLSEEFQSRMP